MSAEPRLTVALTVDHDAISDSVRRGDSPVKFSHAEFGPRVGVEPDPRAARARAASRRPGSCPATPSTTFPDDTDADRRGRARGRLPRLVPRGLRRARRRGAARRPGAVDRGRPRADGRRADRLPRAVLVARVPRRSSLVEAAGLRLRQLADVGRLPAPPRAPRRPPLPSRTARPGDAESGLVEVPVYWALDDWPYFEPGPSRDGLSAPSTVLEIWTRGAPLRPRARPGRPGDGHGPSRVHRARPPDGDARARSSPRRSRCPASSSNGWTPYVSRWLGGALRPPAPAPG